MAISSVKRFLSGAGLKRALFGSTLLTVIAMTTISAGCIGQDRAIPGKTVVVHYTATLQNGTPFETTLNRSHFVLLSERRG